MIIGPNQSFLDAVLMQYGTLEAAMEVAAANDRSITAEIATSDTITTPIVTNNDATVTNYLTRSGITIGTKGT